MSFWRKQHAFTDDATNARTSHSSGRNQDRARSSPPHGPHHQYTVQRLIQPWNPTNRLRSDCPEGSRRRPHQWTPANLWNDMQLPIPTKLVENSYRCCGREVMCQDDGKTRPESPEKSQIACVSPSLLHGRLRGFAFYCRSSSSTHSWTLAPSPLGGRFRSRARPLNKFRRTPFPLHGIKRTTSHGS